MTPQDQGILTRLIDEIAYLRRRVADLEQRECPCQAPSAPAGDAEGASAPLPVRRFSGPWERGSGLQGGNGHG